MSRFRISTLEPVRASSACRFGWVGLRSAMTFLTGRLGNTDRRHFHLRRNSLPPGWRLLRSDKDRQPWIYHLIDAGLTGLVSLRVSRFEKCLMILRLGVCQDISGP